MHRESPPCSISPPPHPPWIHPRIPARLRGFSSRLFPGYSQVVPRFLSRGSHPVGFEHPGAPAEPPLLLSAYSPPTFPSPHPRKVEVVPSRSFPACPLPGGEERGHIPACPPHIPACPLGFLGGCPSLAEQQRWRGAAGSVPQCRADLRGARGCSDAPARPRSPRRGSLPAVPRSCGRPGGGQAEQEVPGQGERLWLGGGRAGERSSPPSAVAPSPVPREMLQALPRPPEDFKGRTGGNLEDFGVRGQPRAGGDILLSPPCASRPRGAAGAAGTGLVPHSPAELDPHGSGSSLHPCGTRCSPPPSRGSSFA